MMTPPNMRAMSRYLLAYEAVACSVTEPVESTTLRVYEKLRQSIGSIAGVAAFQCLAFRALTQAKSESSGLWAAQVEEDGSLQGLGEFKPQTAESELRSNIDQTSEGGAILISRLLELLLLFLGEALTFSLLRNAWPNAPFNEQSSENGRDS